MKTAGKAKTAKKTAGKAPKTAMKTAGKAPKTAKKKAGKAPKTAKKKAGEVYISLGCIIGKDVCPDMGGQWC